MDKDYLAKKMDKLLKEEKEKLEAEIKDKIEQKKALMKDDEDNKK